VAFRIAAASGPLAGIQVIFAFAGLDDVLLGMNFSFADIGAPVLAAYAKASKVLGTSTTGT
jgi:hypothetical protein